MTEMLRYIRYDEERQALVVQLDGGGAACIIEKGMKMEAVVNQLRTLCNQLANDVAARAGLRRNEQA